MKILPNGVAVIDGDTHHGVWCATEGLVHDRWMAAIIRGVIIENNIKLCIDGGANIGTLSMPMLDAGAFVVAFDPNPEAIKCLTHNLAIHDGRFIVVNSGLGDANFSSNLVELENAGASYLSTNSDGRRVGVTTIDEWMSAWNPPGLDAPGLIKLDIEGMEHHALMGAAKTIDRFKPVLIIEVNDGALARNNRDHGYIFSFLIEHKYSMRILQPDCQIGDPQYDIICYPKRHSSRAGQASASASFGASAVIEKSRSWPAPAYSLASH